MSAGSEAERRAFAANVWKSFVYGFLMDLSLAAPIWVLYLRDERGLTLTQITLLEVPLFLLIVLAEVPAGAVADRFGRRTSLMLASGILALAIFVYGSATSYPVILIANVAWGLAFTFRSGADVALLYDSLEQAGRESDFQRLAGRFWALRSAGMLAGLLLGAAVAAHTRFGFAITLGAGIHAGALLVALAMHEPRPRERAREAYRETLAAGVRDVWRRPTLRWLFVFSGIVGAGAAGPLLLLQQPWLAARGIPTAELGAWQAPVQATSMLCALGAGRLLARLGERGAFLALPLALSLCSAALAALAAPWATAAFLGIAAVRGLHEPVLASTVNRHVESRHRATVLSLQSLAGNLTMALVWPCAGLAADLRVEAAFWMYAAGTLVLGGGALLLWGRAEAEEGGGLTAAPGRG